MTRKRMVWLWGGILGILLLLPGVLVIQRPSLQSISNLIAMSDHMTFFVVDNSGKSPVIYEADEQGNISSFRRTTGTAEKDGKITQLVWNGSGISYLRESDFGQEEGKVRLYQCNSGLEQEEFLGEIPLNQGEWINSLEEDNGKLVLVIMGPENQQVKVQQILVQEDSSQEESSQAGGKGEDSLESSQGENSQAGGKEETSQEGSRKLELEQLGAAAAGEQEWFCDAAYQDGAVYLLDHRGSVWRCEGNTREKWGNKAGKADGEETEGENGETADGEAADGEYAAWLRATRGGIFCENRSGQTVILSGENFKETDGMEHMLAVDAMSAKAYVQIGRKLPGDIQINFYEPENCLEITKIHMAFGLLLRKSRGCLLAAGGAGILLWLAGTFLARMLRGPKRTTLRTAGAMVVLQAGMGAALIWGISQGQQRILRQQQLEAAESLAARSAEEISSIDFTAMDIEEITNAGGYGVIWDTIKEWVYRSGERQIRVTGILVHDEISEDGKGAYVTAAARYASGFSLYEMAPEKLLETLEQAGESGSAESCILPGKDGQHSRIFAVVPLGGRITPQDYLISQVEMSAVTGNLWPWILGAWILTDWLLCILLVIYQGRAVDRFAKAVAGAVEGRRREPAFGASGFGPAWVQIQRRIAELEWRRDQEEKKRQAYGRFFPMRFAKLMGHSSLDEITLGEVHRTAGAFLQISVEPQAREMGIREGEAYVKYLNWLMESFGGGKTAREGVILPGGSNPGSIRILYEEQPDQALTAVLGACRRLEQEKDIREQWEPAFLLHYGIYTCGLTGTGESVFPFAFAPEMECLKQYAQKLKTLQVRAAVTEQMLPYIKTEYEYRYIGCMPALKSGEVFRFYEILDAYGQEEKEKRCRTREKFRQALGLFEQNDFYLARTNFSDILKECPKDLVAVRYVFACEQRFHARETEICSHYLFEIEEESSASYPREGNLCKSSHY